MITTRCAQVVIPTMAVALMLSILPLPEWAQMFRPDWVALVLIYWVMAMPERVGVTVAWVFGLLLDVAQGSILGQHALGLVVISYIVLLQYSRIRVFSLLQQAIVVFFLLLIKQLLVLWVNGIIGLSPSIGSYFIPSLVGAALWPWLFLSLRNIRRKFTLTKHY